MYYSNHIDVKEVEARLLSDKIIRCISENGYMKEEILNQSFDVFESCLINQNKFVGNSDYYLKAVMVDDYEERVLIDIGAASLEKDCFVRKVIDADKFPGCVSRTVFLISKGNYIQLNILSASKQVGGTVK